MFTPEQWRIPQQISSLFSRLTAVHHQSDIREEDVTEEDVVAIQSEVAHETLRTTVMNDMAMLTHPIVVGSKNICELVSSNKLHSLKLVDLRAICENLGLEANASSSRKKTYCEPIEKYVKSYLCLSKR